METEPNYEYDAPKWFDFTSDFEGEVNDNLSRDDSWFERIHPLHEPKDPSNHDGTTKPLLTGNQGNTAAASGSKPQTKNPTKKNYSKKSLGIKTIRTKRGQRDSPQIKESGGTRLKDGKLHAQKAARQTSLKDGKKDSNGSNKEDGRVTPDEFQYNFTPPWTNSPIIKREETSHGSNSNMSEVVDVLPQRVLVNHSPFSHARVQSLKSSSLSMSPGSPKTSLLSKAVDGTVQKARRKRRLLPSIPNSKQNPVEAARMSATSGQYSNQLADNRANKKLVEASGILSSPGQCSDQLVDNGANKKLVETSRIFSSPDQCSNQLADDANKKTVKASRIFSSPGQCSNQLADNGANKKPVEASVILSSPSQCSINQLTDKANKKMPNLSQRFNQMDEEASYKETVFGDSIKPLQATDTCVNIGTLNQAQCVDDAYSCRQDKNVVSQRPLVAILENSRARGIGNQAFPPTESEKQISSSSWGEKETSPNDMSVEELLKQHNRKIFAARNLYDEHGRKIRTAEPSFCPAPAKQSSLSSKSSLSATAASKRPSTSMEKSTVSAKQNRRSCMAAFSNVQSESTRSNTRSMPSGAQTNDNKKGKGSSSQQTAKQKRRSCVASIQHDRQSDTADRELRDLIARHNSRVSAKQP